MYFNSAYAVQVECARLHCVFPCMFDAPGGSVDAHSGSVDVFVVPKSIARLRAGRLHLCANPMTCDHMLDLACSNVSPQLVSHKFAARTCIIDMYRHMCIHAHSHLLPSTAVDA